MCLFIYVNVFKLLCNIVLNRAFSCKLTSSTFNVYIQSLKERLALDAIFCFLLHKRNRQISIEIHFSYTNPASASNLISNILEVSIKDREKNLIRFHLMQSKNIWSGMVTDKINAVCSQQILWRFITLNYDMTIQTPINHIRKNTFITLYSATIWKRCTH